MYSLAGPPLPLGPVWVCVCGGVECVCVYVWGGGGVYGVECVCGVYGVCLCVCVCVCVCRLLQLLKDESSASKSFFRLLVMFTWILIRGFAK